MGALQFAAVLPQFVQAEERSMASGQLPQTRYAPPYHRRPGVRRVRILDRFRRESPDIVIIQAPPGYGKTTLASQLRREMLATHKFVAWINLTPDDNSYEDFGTGLVQAFAEAGCDFAKESLALIKPGIRRSIDAATAVFANDLVTSGKEYFLFVDDVHAVKADEILPQIRSLLTVTGGRIGLVLVSRVPVPLDLLGTTPHRKIMQVDVNELRFSFNESRRFLKDRRSEEQADSDNLGKVYEITEGWVIAMEWAAAAIEAGSPVSAVRDALFDETGPLATSFSQRVLAGLEPTLRKFLLQTSVLDSFNVELAAAVTGNPQSVQLLNRAQHEMSLLLPVEHEAKWFRYHPLYLTALREDLVREYLSEQRGRTEAVRGAVNVSDPDGADYERVISQLSHPEYDLYELHRRAAQWHMDAGMTEHAVNHFLAVNDVSSVTGMLDSAALALLENGKINTLIRLAQRLPEHALRNRPRLQLCIAWAFTLTCRTSEAEELLLQLEAAVEANDKAGDAVEPETVDVQPDEVRALRAAYSIFIDDTRAAEAVSKNWGRRGDSFSVAAGCNCVSFALIVAGRHEEARETLSWVEQKPKVRTLFFPYVYRQSALALSYALEGAISKSNEIASAALALAEKRTGRRSAPACILMSVLSDGYYEQNRLAELRDFFSFRFDIINESVFPDALIRAYLSAARTYWALNDAQKSAELLDQLYASGIEHGHLRVMASSLAEKCRQSIAQDKLDVAGRLQDRLEKMLPPDARLSFDTQGELVLLVWLSRARLALVSGESQRARDELGCLIDFYANAGRRRLMARLRLMRAVASLQLGDVAEAASEFKASLSLGVQCQLNRSFTDDRMWCQMLLERMDERKLGEDNFRYIDGLMSEGVEPQRASATQDVAIDVAMTPKELEVLKLLEQGLPTKRIAVALTVSPETVRWHLKNIYSKLAVGSRFDAVDRARTLALL